MPPINKKVHFMGIGGSGVSGVAVIAHSQGYEISGCDLQTDTPYLVGLKKLGIKIFVGHNENHIHNSDILAVSPSVFFQNSTQPEVTLAKKVNKLITWQNFVGDYLQRGKKLICIAGTHGKSTTTALAGFLFENAKVDPLVVIGANVDKWGGNARIGKGEIFITESDEFYDNFLNYTPETIVLNNIEFDHPDYFKDETMLLNSFAKHIKSLKGGKTLIFNQDSPGIKKLFDLLKVKNLSNLELLGYTISDKPLINTNVSIKAEAIKLDKDKTSFIAKSTQLDLNNRFVLKLKSLFSSQLI